MNVYESSREYLENQSFTNEESARTHARTRAHTHTAGRHTHTHAHHTNAHAHDVPTYVIYV